MIDFGKTEQALQEAIRLLGQQNLLLLLILGVLVLIAHKQRPRPR